MCNQRDCNVRLKCVRALVRSERLGLRERERDIERKGGRERQRERDRHRGGERGGWCLHGAQRVRDGRQGLALLPPDQNLLRSLRRCRANMAHVRQSRPDPVVRVQRFFVTSIWDGGRGLSHRPAANLISQNVSIKQSL